MKIIQQRIFLFLFFSLCCQGNHVFAQSSSAAPGQVKTGTVTGIFVVKDGGRMSGGQILFFSADNGPPPHFSLYTRIPSFIGIIKEGNYFKVTLPVGRYYLRAIKRISGKNFGPPLEGSYIFSFKDEKRTWKTFTIKEGEQINLGPLEAFFRPGKTRFLPGKTTIEGTIRDINGAPVANGYVFAFATPRMLGKRPEFVSNRTGKDGKYTLKIPSNAANNTYYLMARDVMGGGQIKEDGIIGFYGNARPMGVSIQLGEAIRGKDILVAKMGHRGPDLKPGEEKNVDFRNIGSKKPSVLPTTGKGLQQNTNEKEDSEAD